MLLSSAVDIRMPRGEGRDEADGVAPQFARFQSINDLF